MSKKKEEVVAIGLFSGCGGLDIGSHMAGVPPILCLDFDKDCIKTLQANKIFRDSKIYHTDIVNFPFLKYKNALKKRKAPKFIVIGGPPCQPFSKAGYWIGNKARKGEKDPRNMIGEYLNVISKIRPDGFIFENVESLLHPTNKKVVEKIIKEISKMNYKYKLIRANSLDYGVPQKRKRIFIIGSKKGFKTTEPRKTHCAIEYVKETGLKPYINTGQAISKYDKDQYFEPKEITSKGTYGKELKKVPPGKNYIALSEKGNISNPKFKAGTRFWSFLLKLHPDMPSWTIAAQPGPWVGPFHWTSRRLRVPEIAAIQTFPENYIFVGSRRSIQKQIGNAVPPLMAKAMVEFLKENL